MDRIRILQAQIRVSEEKNTIPALLEGLFEKAVENNTDLLTLPEMFNCPYENALFPLRAEPEGGETWSLCSSLAKKYGLYFSAGSIPELDDGKIYNTAYVFDREGRQIAKHRKMHLFDINVKGGQAFRESDTLAPGNDVTVFDTEFGKIGLCVCFDFRFPELGRLMAVQGARLVLCPAAFNRTTGPAHWELMFRAQAMFNQYFALGTAPALDDNAKYHSWGHTIAVSPWGDVIAQMGQEEGYQVVEIDLKRAEDIREQIPLLNNRRTDVYSLELF